MLYYSYTGRCRLFFGNILPSLTEADFLKMLKPYGETEDMFLNAKKGFGFVKLVSSLPDIEEFMGAPYTWVQC